jgi:hypothetical protein
MEKTTQDRERPKRKWRAGKINGDGGARQISCDRPAEAPLIRSPLRPPGTR